MGHPRAQGSMGKKSMSLQAQSEGPFLSRCSLNMAEATLRLNILRESWRNTEMSRFQSYYEKREKVLSQWANALGPRGPLLCEQVQTTCSFTYHGKLHTVGDFIFPKRLCLFLTFLPRGLICSSSSISKTEKKKKMKKAFVMASKWENN